MKLSLFPRHSVLLAAMLLLEAVVQAAPLHPCGLIREDPRTIPWMIQDSIVPRAPRRLDGAVDLSSQMPPVGDQGQQGSCTAWAIGYYMKTHYEYLEHHWNDSVSSHQFSPAFIYNQINGGVDQGSGTSEAFALIADQGCATLADCPYSQSDYTTWPSESAYARAIPFRGGSSHYFWMQDDDGIDAAKTRLDNGYTTAIAIQVYSNFDNIQNFDYTYCVADTYGGIRGGHLVTIVGYDDTMTTNDGTGAFKMINSWGTGWGQSGYWWMSYVAAKSSALSQQVGFYIDDLTGYSPTMVGRVKITHAARDKIGIRLGVGRTSSPYWSKNFRTWRHPLTDRAFPNHNIVFDMTEGASYITGGQTDSVFVRAIDDSSDSKSGTINYFSATHLAWGRTGISTDTPVNIPDYNTAVYARAKIPRPRDVGVTRIFAPTGTVDSGTTITPQARVRNYGVDAVTFPVTFRIGSSYADTRTVNSLAGQDSTLVNFTSWAAAPRGILATRCSTALTNDDNHANDTLPGSVTVRVTNVGVTAILAPPDTVDSGTVVTPQAWVRNYGTATVSFPVFFRIGSFYNYSQTVTNLAPGNSALVSFASWTAEQVGTHVKRCSTALSGDQVHGNDTLSGTVTVRSVAVIDAGVTAIIAPTGTVDSGANITPQVRVKNFGTGAATFPVTFNIGSSYADTQTVSLAAGDSVLVDFSNWVAAPRGLLATRCSTALTDDQYHTNDTLPGSVTVQVINVGVTSIVAPSDTVDSGTIVTPQARVRNYGTAAASFPVKLRIGSLYSDSQSVSSLAPSESALVSFAAWTPLQRGTFVKRCTTALPGDVILADDTLSGSAMVRVTDVGVVGINRPAGSYGQGEAFTPAATIRNNGNVPTGCEVWMLLTDPHDSLYYSDSVNVADLDTARSLVVSTFQPCSLQLLGDWTARCSTAVAGDLRLDNNVMSGGFKIRTPWVEREPVPEPPSYEPVKDGAWLAYDAGSGLVYAGKGNNSSDFCSYNNGANEWTQCCSIPPGLEAKPPRQGACGVGDGAGHIYMVKGNNTLGFWRYDVAADSWLQLADVPVGSSRRVKAGSGVVYAEIGDSGFVYLLKGPTCEFYRFNVTTGTWETMPSAPEGERSKWYDGSFLVFDGDRTIYAHKAKYHELWAYDIVTAAWGSTQLAGMPYVGRDADSRQSRGGGSGVWFEGAIYALKGGSTGEFWRYDAAADSWTEFNQLPPLGSSGTRRVSTGGCMVNVDGTLFALKGNQTNELWRYSLASRLALQIPREGVMAGRVATGVWGVAIRPNPLVSGFAVVRCNLPKGGSATLELFDASGRRVHQPFLIRHSEFRLDLRSMPAGVYIVKVTTDGFSTTQKLVVEH